MDGRVYNYNTGPWNACNENFQAACLELQNTVPNSRENHLVRDPSKAMASAPSFMFLNYPTEDHIHPSNQHVMHRTAQWHMQQWPKMKAHPGHGHKNIGMMKDDWSGMTTTMQAGHSLFNIPPPGPFCSSELTDVIQDNTNSVNVVQPNPGVSYGGDNRPSIMETQQQVQNISPPKPTVKKTNPQPRKKREKKKTNKEVKKRTRNEESWARNKRKKARARGESYMSVVGKMMRAKEVQPVDCSKCKFHCPDHVSEKDRQKLFQHYWSLESFKDKVNFLSECVEEFVPLRPISGKRLYSRRYKLKIGEGDDEKIARVCKEFFISTFDISESTIVTFMNKKRKNPDEIKDNRGHQIPSNKTPPEVVQSIREHILSQTGLQGCLTKFHMEEVKNMKRLYTHYQTECEAESKKPASMSVYRKVYGDMHKDKKEAPVILPPEEVLEKMAPKKAKPLKVDSPLPLAPSTPDDDADEVEDNDDDDDVSSGVPLPSEPLNLTPLTMSSNVSHQQQPQQQQQVVSSSSCSMVVNPGISSNDIMSTTTTTTTANQLHHHHHQQLTVSRQMSREEKPYGLNIPMSMSHQHLLDANAAAVSQMPHAADDSIVAPSFDATGAHINQIMPLMWGTHRMSQPGGQADISNFSSGIRGMHQSFSGVASTFPNTINQNPMHHMTQSCLFNTNPNTALGSSSSAISSPTSVTTYVAAAVPPQTAIFPTNPSLSTVNVQGNEEVVVVKKLKKPRPRPKAKPKKEVKKRTRNEESWGRNIRKRLRFKGEEYISVKGKTVGAKKVQKVDCSKCKYKCSTKITEEQRLEMNEEYWKLDNYEKRIEFISRYVETYVPKRKMTGRRAYSRNYTFIVDDKHVRVCKNFFISTLHISESIVATCLKKARKGPSATKDMRGKHKPVNKTPEEVLQNIRELIIYLTGVRPKRKGDKFPKTTVEYQDINRLYLIYKYDSEQKGKKMASYGIFRNVLISEFGFTGNPKCKKSLITKMNSKFITGRDFKGDVKARLDAALLAQRPTNKKNSIVQDSNASSISSVIKQSKGVVPEQPNSQPVFDNGNTKQPEPVEVSEGSSTHPVFSTCLLSSF